jgi:chorismate synthase
MIRYLTAGESHGEGLTTILEGIPAGVVLTEETINLQLERRQCGYGRGARMRIEKDRVSIRSGVRNGFTIGTPITLAIKNRDWENWKDVMSAAPGCLPPDYKPVTIPRPGHADMAGTVKFNFTDIRNVIERASARETAARVAVGTVCRELLKVFDIHIASHVVSISNIVAPRITPSQLTELLPAIESSPVRCADKDATQKMMSAIDEAKEKGDTMGGVFEIVVYNVPPGLGSYTQWDQKLDGRIAHAVMSIQAIKGVEFGLGFATASTPGSLVHDEIFYSKQQGVHHKTNSAGGIEGGVSNGNPLIIRAAMKPIPTLMKPLATIDLSTFKPVAASKERSDVCAVPAASVVGEAVVAIELAKAMKEKFGGDNLHEMKQNFTAYTSHIAQKFGYKANPIH